MKYAARKDGNQDEIVEAIRNIGATVTSVHQIGNGLPDLLVGFRGKNYLFEIKDRDKPPSKRKLTDDEKQWHNMWQGHCHVVKSVNEALDILLN